MLTNSYISICFNFISEQRALDVVQAFDTDLRTWTLLVAQIHGILDVYRELLHLRYLTQFQVQYHNVLVVCSGENLRYAIEQVVPNYCVYNWMGIDHGELYK